MKKEQSSTVIIRLVILFLFLLALFSFIIIQFYKIQIIQGEKWSQLANAQHHFTIIESCKRGRFFANNSVKDGHNEKPQVLVLDVAKFHLFVDPLAIKEEVRNEIVNSIVEILQLEAKKREEILLQFTKQSRSRKILAWLDSKEKEMLESWWIPYAKDKKIPSNGLFFIKDFKRSHPYGKLLGAVLNTVRDDREETTFQNFPTGGLEVVFDDYLKGKPGKRLLLRSPRNPLESGVILEEAEDGADIYLTINPYLQAIVEEEIEKGVVQSKAKSGWAVMMDPHTGEIYALGQYPSFNPASYRENYNDPDLIEFTKVRAVVDCFEPGSTMKPISIAIGFLANEELKRQGRAPIFDPLEMIPVANGEFPGRKKPITDVGRTHHYLNMYLAMQKSSNIYVARVIQKVIASLGEEWYRKQLEEVFGFGKKTGLEFPYESSGLLPYPGKISPGKPLNWSKATPFSLAIGYNLLANSMQMIRAFAIICNGGYDVKPTLIKKIVKREEILFESKSHLEKKLLLNPSISREIVYALKSVTKPGGYASRADIPGYTEAGKTGTTEKVINGTYSKTNHFSSFIGFAPADNPRFVLLIAIDEPAYRHLPGTGMSFFGGGCASPVFRNILTRTFKYLGIPPDDPYGYSIGDPRYDFSKADYSSQVKMLQELYKEWNK